MDRKERKKWQVIGVIAAEALMVLSVIAIVVAMTLVALGYNFGKNGEIEQSGLMQLHTIPTGATVQLDDETLFARSNLSQTMSPGTHHLKITKDGYDSWEKDIMMSPGWLMRLYYPRLFLVNRETEQIEALGDLMFYSPSEDRNFILYAETQSTKWTLANIKNNDVNKTTIDVSALFSCVSDGKFLGAVQRVQWNENSDRVLFKVAYNNSVEWVLVDLKDVAMSVNLTKEFGLNFETMELASASASDIMVLENGNLRKINVDGKSISRVLISQVASFDNHGADIVYVTKANEQGGRKIGVYKDGAKNSVIVKNAKSSDKVLVGSSAYYDDDYLIYAINKQLYVYRGEYPKYDAETMHDSNEISLDAEDTKMTKILETELGLNADKLVVSRGGEYILAHENNKTIAIDLDTEKVINYNARSNQIKWLDDSMLYDVIDGKIVVWDFDGTNERELVSSDVNGKTVVISGNNKYLYYVKNSELVREKIQ